MAQEGILQVEERIWYSIKTRCRSEKRVAARLSSVGSVEVYLPLCNHGRLPLIPQYLFFRCNPIKVGICSKIDGTIAGSVKAVNNQEIELVRKMEAQAEKDHLVRRGVIFQAVRRKGESIKPGINLLPGCHLYLRFESVPEIEICLKCSPITSEEMDE